MTYPLYPEKILDRLYYFYLLFICLTKTQIDLYELFNFVFPYVLSIFFVTEGLYEHIHTSICSSSGFML